MGLAAVVRATGSLSLSSVRARWLYALVGALIGALLVPAMADAQEMSMAELETAIDTLWVGRNVFIYEE